MPEPASKMDTPSVYQADGRIGKRIDRLSKDFRQTRLPPARATWHAIGTIEQLGLFDSATSHLAAARRALGRFDLDCAERTEESTERAAPLAFVDLIARERAGRTLEDRVAVRRRMKALAPTLFDAYLRAFA